MKKEHTTAPVLLFAFLITITTISLAQSTEETSEQLGQVSFANSCEPNVQGTFERAVALLHSFWWQEGERTFRKVLKQDPKCAIATWGVATIIIGNPFASGPSWEQAQQAIIEIEHGLTISSITERERHYIEAVSHYYDNFTERSHTARIMSLSNAFQNLAKRFPEDDEAQIFSALYLRATQKPADKTFSLSLKAAAILEPLFDKYPDHPGVAHYLIHCYDYPPIAEKGLDAAYRYSEIAPSAPHALHMPSHIFTRVGAWQESISSNLRSESVAKAKREFADQLHAMDYLIYAYLQLAHDKQAQIIVDEAPSVKANKQLRITPYALAAIPARYAIERGAWNEAAQLEVQETNFRYTAALTHFARALGAARSGDTSAAKRDVVELARIVDALKSANNIYWAVEVEVQRMGAEAWVLYAQGNLEEALPLMRSAADLEDTSEKAAVSPGRLLPARELLGDMLLESDQPLEALAEYEQSHDHDPNRYRTLYGAGQAAVQAGNQEKANHYFKKLIEMASSGDNRPELEQVRHYLARN